MSKLKIHSWKGPIGLVAAMLFFATGFSQTPLDTIPTPYTGNHTLQLHGEPQLTFGSVQNTLVKGGLAGELDDGQIGSTIENKFSLDPIDLSGDVNLDWTYDMSHIGIDLSPIGGPDWNLGTWGIEPIATAWAGIDLGIKTDFYSEGSAMVGDGGDLEMDVDIPIQLTYSIPEYEKGENLVIIAKSWIPEAPIDNPHVNFVNGDFSKDLNLNFGAGSEVGVDIHLGPFGVLGPRIIDFGFTADEMGDHWADGISLIRANRNGFSGELGLVARPIFMHANNQMISVANGAADLANKAIGALDLGPGGSGWNLADGNINFAFMNNFFGNTLGMNGGSFDVVQMLIDASGNDADMQAIYCMYKAFNDPIGFDIPDLSNLFNFDYQLNFNVDLEFDLNELEVNTTTLEEFHHPGYDENAEASEWVTDWAFYGGNPQSNTDVMASFYAYQDEEEPILYYSNLCMANNDDNPEDDSAVNDNTAKINTSGSDGGQLKKIANAYKFTSSTLGNSVTQYAGEVKATSMLLFKKIAQFAKMPTGRSKAKNTNKGGGALRNKAPSMYQKAANGKKTLSKYRKYQKQASKIPAWAIFCEPTVDAIDVMEELFSGNWFASSFIGATGDLLDEVHLKEPSATKWFTTAPQLDLMDNFGISMTARAPTTVMTSDPGLQVTQSGYRFRSQTLETSEWLEVRHNYFDTFEQIAEIYCPVLAPTPPCAALVALEMRKSEDNNLLDQYLPAGKYDKESGKINVWSFSGSSLLGPAQSLLGMIEKANEVITCATESNNLNPGGAASTALSVNNAAINFLDWGMSAVTSLELLNIWVKYNLLDVENKFSLSNQFNASFDANYKYRFVVEADATTNPADLADTTLTAALTDEFEHTTQWYSAQDLRAGVRVEVPTNCADATKLKVIARIEESSKATMSGSDRIADSLLYNLFNFEAGIEPVTIIPSFDITFLCVGSIEEFAESLGSCVAKAIVSVVNWFCKVFGGSKCFKEGKCKTCSYGFPGLKTPGWSTGVGHDDAIDLATFDDNYLSSSKEGNALLAELAVDVVTGDDSVANNNLYNQDILVDEFRVPANVFSLSEVDVFRSPGFDENIPVDSTVIAQFHLETTLTQLTGTFQDFMVPLDSAFTPGSTALEASAAESDLDAQIFVGSLPTSLYGEWGVKAPSGCNATIIETIPAVPMPNSYTVDCIPLPDGQTWPDGSTGCFCADLDQDMCNDCANSATPDTINDGLNVYFITFSGTVTDSIISDGDYDNDFKCDFGDTDDDNDGVVDFEDPQPFNQLIFGDLDGDGDEDGWCQDYDDNPPFDTSNCHQYQTVDDIHTDAPCLMYNSVRYVRCDTQDIDGDNICNFNDPDADGDGVPRSPDANVANGDFKPFDTNDNGFCDLDEIVDSVFVSGTDELAFVRHYDCDDKVLTACYSIDGDDCDDCINIQIPNAPDQGPDGFNDGADFDRDGLCDSSDEDDDNDGVTDSDEPTYFGSSMAFNPMFCGGAGENDPDESDGVLPCDSCMQNWITYAKGPLNSHLLNTYASDDSYNQTNIKAATLAIWDGESLTNQFNSANVSNLQAAIEGITLENGQQSVLLSEETVKGDSLINLRSLYGHAPGSGDLDSDGICDAADPDIDGDNVDNPADADPYNRFVCRDADQDGCDDCAFTGVDNVCNDGYDYDHDCLCDNREIQGESIPKHLDLDIDGDGRLDGRFNGVLDSLLLQQIGLIPGNIQINGGNNTLIHYRGQDTLELVLNDPDLFGPIQKENQLSIWKYYSAEVVDPDPFDSLYCGDLDLDNCDDCASGKLDIWLDGPNKDVAYAEADLGVGATLDQKIALGADSLNDFGWEVIIENTQAPVSLRDAQGHRITLQWNTTNNIWEDSRSAFFDNAALQATGNAELISDAAVHYPRLVGINPSASEFGNPSALDSVISFVWDGESQIWIDSDTANGDIQLPSDFYENYSDGDTLDSGLDPNELNAFVQNPGSVGSFFNDSLSWVIHIDSLTTRKKFGDIDADGDGIYRTFIYRYNAFAQRDAGYPGERVYTSQIVDGATELTVEPDTDNSKIYAIDDDGYHVSLGFHDMTLRDSLHRYGAIITGYNIPDTVHAPNRADTIVLDASASACDLFGVVNDYWRQEIPSTGGNARYNYYPGFICLSDAEHYARKVRRFNSAQDSAQFVVAQNGPAMASGFQEEDTDGTWVSTYGHGIGESVVTLVGTLTVDSASAYGFEYSLSSSLSPANTVFSTNYGAGIGGSSTFTAEIEDLSTPVHFYYRAFAVSNGSTYYGIIREGQTFSDDIDKVYQANKGRTNDGVLYEDDNVNYPYFRKALVSDAINQFDFISLQDTVEFDINDLDNTICIDADNNGVDDCSDHTGTYATYQQSSLSDELTNDAVSALRCQGWYKPTFYLDLDGDGLGTNAQVFNSCNPPDPTAGGLWSFTLGDNCDDPNAFNFDDPNNEYCDCDDDGNPDGNSTDCND